MKKALAASIVLTALLVGFLLSRPTLSPCQRFAAKNSKNYVQFDCIDSTHAIYKKNFGKKTDSTDIYIPKFLFYGTVNGSKIHVDSLLEYVCRSFRLPYYWVKTITPDTFLTNGVPEYDFSDSLKLYHKYFSGFREFYLEFMDISPRKVNEDSLVKIFARDLFMRSFSCDPYVKGEKSFWGIRESIKAPTGLFVYSQEKERTISWTFEKHDSTFYTNFIWCEGFYAFYDSLGYQIQATDSTLRVQYENGEVVFYDEIRDSLEVSFASNEPKRGFDFYKRNGQVLRYESGDSSTPKLIETEFRPKQ